MTEGGRRRGVGGMNMWLNEGMRTTYLHETKGK